MPAATKIELIDRLSATGLQTIEATSFVSPKWVPQLADAAEVFAGIAQARACAIRCWCRTCRATSARARSAPTKSRCSPRHREAFNRKNINASIDESIERFSPVLERAHAPTACACAATFPPCSAARTRAKCRSRDVVRVARRLHELGCYEISLGDTIGVGTPAKARAMLRAVAQEVPMAALAVHFHDTYGQALANILACLEEGVRVVDSSVSGTGGCPYAKGATGNVATEDVVYMLHGMGMHTGIDLDQLVATGVWLAAQLHKDTASRVTRARTAVV